MIEALWSVLRELVDYVFANFDPIRDLIDIALVTLGIYWLLLLIRGTRAVQILVGLIVLLAASVASEIFQLVTLRLILENFLGYGIIIIVILFQHDIRRALARVGRGFFPSVSAQQESQMLEEVVRAAQTLAQRRIGALMVLERENHLDDQMETGTALDAAVSKELLISLFLPYSPLHDGAAVIQQRRIAFAGCILPLTAARGSSGRRRHPSPRGGRHHGGDRRAGDRGIGGDRHDLGGHGRRDGAGARRAAPPGGATRSALGRAQEPPPPRRACGDRAGARRAGRGPRARGAGRRTTCALRDRPCASTSACCCSPRPSP
jgi:uncharacterized protein (TIGR00159 family)